MKNIFMVTLLCMGVPLVASLRTEWEYSKAISCAQDEQWADAQQRMSVLMIDDPDDPELLYDSGVAAYRMKEYPKAEAYFRQTAENEHSSDRLKEKALFNLGNTEVALNKLEESIDLYEAALAIDPHDERAQYNLEKVRELLEQQKQQQEDQQQNKQDKEQNKDQQKDQSQQNQQQQQQSSPGDQSDSNEQQGSKQEQKGKEQQQGADKEQTESTSQERDEQGADQQEEGERKDDANDKFNDEHPGQEQEQCADTHDSSPQKNAERDEQLQAQDSDPHHTKEEDESQEMQAGELNEQGDIEPIQAKQQKELEEGLAPEDRWMVRVLRQREQADEKANKRIVKATIDKELAGKDGQNCW